MKREAELRIISLTTPRGVADKIRAFVFITQVTVILNQPYIVGLEPKLFIFTINKMENLKNCL